MKHVQFVFFAHPYLLKSNFKHCNSVYLQVYNLYNLLCFTVGTMHFSLYSSPLQRRSVWNLSEPKTLIFVSSLQVYSPSSLRLCQHEPRQILDGLLFIYFCVCVGFSSGLVCGRSYACHSFAVYVVWCHGKHSSQFDFLMI